MSNPKKQEGVKEESEVPKPWPLVGYAPGNYNNQCAGCKNLMRGVDKLCFMCLECAVIVTKQHIAELLAASQPRADVHEEVRTWRSIWDQAYKMGQLDFQKEMRRQFTITRKEKGEAK